MDKIIFFDATFPTWYSGNKLIINVFKQNHWKKDIASYFSFPTYKWKHMRCFVEQTKKRKIQGISFSTFDHSEKQGRKLFKSECVFTVNLFNVAAALFNRVMTQELQLVLAAVFLEKNPINICTKEMFEFSFAYYPSFALNFLFKACGNVLLIERHMSPGRSQVIMCFSVGLKKIIRALKSFCGDIKASFDNLRSKLKSLLIILRYRSEHNFQFNYICQLQHGSRSRDALEEHGISFMIALKTLLTKAAKCCTETTS